MMRIGLHSTVHIVASPFKTGTSSIAVALRMLGVGHHLMPYRGDLLARAGQDIRRVNQIARQARSFLELEQTLKAEPLVALEQVMASAKGFDVFHDAPLGHSHIHPLVLKAIAPNARLIWVKRPKAEWLASVQQWEQSHPKTYPRQSLWDSHPDQMVALKMRRRRRARRHFAAFKRQFPKDALILEWSDLRDYQKLAEFCSVPAPKGPFPHKNPFKTSAITKCLLRPQDHPTG